MALIRLDNELDRWLEEVAALPEDNLDEMSDGMLAVPFVDVEMDQDIQWAGNYLNDADLLDDTISSLDDLDDDMHDDLDDF